MVSRAMPVSKLKVRRRKARMILTASLGALFLVLVGGVIALAWSPYMRIHTVEVVGVESVNAMALQVLVMQMAEGRRGLVFPKNNTFVFPYKETAAHLRTAYPVFREVEVKRSGLHTVAVHVVERTAVALWCGESAASLSSCYLLDQSGIAYTAAAEYSGQVYVRYYGALDTKSRQFVSQGLFEEVAAVVDTLRELVGGTQPLRVEINMSEVTVIFENNFSLLFSSDHGGADVLERFSLALKAEPFVGKEFTNFEYLDLRFGDKLYYKLKEQ